MRAMACANQGRQREEQAACPPPKKKPEGGGGGDCENSPQPPNRPPTPPEAAKPPPPEGTEDRTPEEAQGDHQGKTGNTKPGTAAHREKGHRNMQTHTTKKKKRPSSRARKQGDGGTGTTRPGTGTPSKKKKKETQKTHPDNPATKGWAQPTPGAGTQPTPHAGTRNGGGQAGRARHYTRPLSRPKPNPNHEHGKQPTLEGQHHKPCPNTPTQDPSQDWRG